MDIHVISSTWHVDSPDLMGFVIARLPNAPDGIPVVHADAYGAEGLVGILEVRAARGERGILVWECSRSQVQAVLEWGTCDDEMEFEDLEIYLVRKQEEQKA